MKNRIRTIALLIMLLAVTTAYAQKGNSNASVTSTAASSGLEDRKYWSELLYKISLPVVKNIAEGTLKKNMPLELGPGYYLKADKVSYMEAVGRTIAGLAPWLALPDDMTSEGVMRKELRDLLLTGLKNAVDPGSPDYLNFTSEYQPLVDAAYIAHAFLRAPAQLWEPLDELTRSRYIEEFKNLRTRKPWYSNWLLFSAMTETFLLSEGEQYDHLRIDVAVRKLKEWYVGDGWYSDGELFAADYYNSFVMHSMLVDILKVLVDNNMAKQEEYDQAVQRMVRYSEFQERIISPEGTFPPIGRSITYRTGAFQSLAQVALMEKLPAHISPAQVRCALTAVMKNMFGAEGTFDSNGWLQLGFAGHQPGMADQYTSTGSLYITTLSFLPLGLPADNPFWSLPPAGWTARRAWSGESVKKDYKVDY
jgi:hypothetical protein